MNKRAVEILTVLWFAGGLALMRPHIARAADEPGSSAAAFSNAAAREPTRRVLELEQIVVTGNSHLSDSAIIGSLQLTARDTVNAAIFEAARLRLLSEQPLLSAADFSTRPGSRRGLVILDIAVAERKPVVFETGYGYHDTYGWFLTLLGIRVDPAAAHGTELRLGLRLGFHLAGLDGKFERQGGPGGFGWGGSFHLYSQEQLFFGGDAAPATWGAADTSRYTREFRQKIGRAGAELYLLYRLRDSTGLSLGFRAERVRPESSFVDDDGGAEFAFTDFPPSVQADVRRTTITGLFLRGVRDTRDLREYPRSGSFMFLQVQSNGTWLGGDKTFSRVEGDFRKYIGLGNWRVLSGRLASGLVSSGTPYYDRFLVGGAYSIRGFRGLSLSPPSGSDGFAIGSGEFRFPLIASPADVPPRLSGLVFVDAGFGWNRGDRLEATDIQAAAGYGLRLRLPWIGMLGLDVGVPFTDGRTGDTFYVNGCLGFSF